ncbi:MAG TPA: BatA domain-containing protein, partial [Longimicrobium sp.]|nr:BatA domain-containing protein [Longimicrobium sp.]
RQRAGDDDHEAALVPLALHLIRRRPPARAPLPTERFLSPDPRTSVRVSRPTDPLLLVLRMLLLILAGAAFARPVWIPKSRGTSEIVLLDRGAAMASGDGWRQAVSAARQHLLSVDGKPRGELVLFDTAAVHVRRRRITPALFDSLAAAPPSASTVRYGAALRAIPGAARELRGADSVRVTMITRPRWSAWSDGLAPLRRAMWPGSIGLIALPAAPPADSVARDTTPRRAAVIADPRDPVTSYPVAALEATGWSVSVVAPGQALPADARLIVASAALPNETVGEILARVDGGATLLADATAIPSITATLPWAGPARADSAAGAMWFGDGLHVAGAAGRVTGEPERGASVIAAWDDGRPAAVARRTRAGCMVVVGTSVGRGEMVLDAAYPRVLERLARGCESPANAFSDDAPLDAGARAVLAGAGARTVAAGTLRAAGGGTGLGRWVMAAALLVALAETFLAYGRKRAA